MLFRNKQGRYQYVVSLFGKTLAPLDIPKHRRNKKSFYVVKKNNVCLRKNFKMGQDIAKLKKSNLPLSEFRKKKLLYEFNTFYDLNKDGVITETDFFVVQQFVCKLNGWLPDSEKYEMTEELFRSIWKSLKTEADMDQDDEVTAEEWVKMWEGLDEVFQKGKTTLPEWLTTYLWCRFNIYDRTGDGEIDAEEFAYVLENFGIAERPARQCFTMMTMNGTKPLDFAYFCELAIEYYTSDDPSALGNFITGRLEF